MLVSQQPSALQACRSSKVFGSTSAQSRTCGRVRSSHQSVTVATVRTGVKVPLERYGGVSVQGSARKRNEDRFDLQVADAAEAGQPFVYAGVFDGHGEFVQTLHTPHQLSAFSVRSDYTGGTATSEWLKARFSDFLGEHWGSDGQNPQEDITQAFLQADKALLAPKKGFFGGMSERGVGGSKCGATGAVAVMYQDRSGRTQLLAANAGDARVILARKGKAVQLTEDHVPDMERERQRIESKNPNPRLPLVRYVGGTWRVGGILALSRAFGDAYLKGSGQFEGVSAGCDGYGSGFGVVADPTVSVTQLSRDDTWIIVASDGLFENEVRGGGGGLDNQEAVDMCLNSKKSISPEQLASQLVEAAQQAGTTDDVTVAVLRLAL